MMMMTTTMEMLLEATQRLNHMWRVAANERSEAPAEKQTTERHTYAYTGEQNAKKKKVNERLGESV